MPKYWVKSFLWLLFLMTIAVSYSCFTAETEDGLDLFLKAIIHQSRSKILSGSGSYVMTRNEYKTEEEIQDKIDKEIALFQQILPDDDPGKELTIANIPQSVRDSVSRTRRGTFRFDNTQKGYQYLENQLIFNNDSENSDTTTIIEKRDFRKRVPHIETAQMESIASLAIVSNIGSSVADFSNIGRLQGLAINLVMSMIEKEGDLITRDELEKQIKKGYESKKDTKLLEIVETKPFDDGATSYILESAIDGKVTQRYTIVPSLGYICPKIEFFDQESGNAIQEYEAKDFVKHTRSGLYYPTYFADIRYDASTGKLKEKREYKINQETLLLNEKMSPKDFALDIPEGLRIQDIRDGNKVNYVATAAGVLSLDSGGLDLEKMTWLRNIDSTPETPDEYKGLFLRVILLTVGVILVVWGLIWKRRNKKSAAV